MKIELNLDIEVAGATEEQLERIRLVLRRSALTYVFEAVDLVGRTTGNFSHENASVSGNAKLVEV